MSRSYCIYDEDWQRRKSVLIRSLFHDIPILSPVEEESNDSSHDYYVPTQEVFPSPSRPYSPLPPLIIEKIPITNKHDEPEEYYRKLHKRMKKIYEKLFIEKRNVSSVDFDSNYSDSSINDDREYNTEGSGVYLVYETENNSPENVSFARQSSASTKSNGYGADFESIDTAVIDVVNQTASNEDIIMISEEEESENANIDEDGIRYEDFGNCRSSENKEFSTERMDDAAFSEKEESHHSTVNDQDTTESEESDETEIEQNYEAEDSDNEIIHEHEMIEETSQTRQSNTFVIVVPDDNKGEESHHSIIDNQEMTKSDKSNEKENNVIKAVRNSNNQKSKWEEFKRSVSVGRNDDEPVEADVETSQSSEGPHYRQITTEALIHFDGFQVPRDRESIVYEDSVKSIILPTRYRRMLASRNVDVEDQIEVCTGKNEDPIASTFEIAEHETTEEDLKEVTTSHSDTTFDNDEEISTHQPDAIEEDDEEMSAPQSDAKDRSFEAIGTRQTGVIAEDDEEMSTGQSDYSEEIDTNHGANKEIEERRNLDSDDTDEENEAWHQPNDAGDIEEMRTPGRDTIEEDDEEMSTHQAEKDVEKTGTPPQDASYRKTEEISAHQPLADVQNDAKRAPRLDECDIEEMSLTQRDLTINVTFEKETAHRNTTDEEIKTRIPGTNGEEMRTSQTEVTGEEIEKILTPRPKAIKKQMRTKVPESTVIEMKIHQPAATDDVEEMESLQSIELMRTPRPDLSHGTIPITQRSSSGSSNDHTALPQELTALTSSIQDGANSNISELQISNDMNEILTSIFNESRTKDETPIARRKRKLVDKSVQAVETNRLTWEEMRANFFVGTPKIFRLCACSDHICS